MFPTISGKMNRIDQRRFYCWSGLVLIREDGGKATPQVARPCVISFAEEYKY